MSAPDPESLAADDRTVLLAVARASIEHGLCHGRALTVDSAEYSLALRQDRASFVTLERAGHLRGCIGALKAYRPLVCDVAAHAYAAAFQDPRFPPLQATEATEVALSISVLSPPQPLHCAAEADLWAQLRPGVDGLILQFRHHRATFLPAVWQHLPKPEQFVTHLKDKAGLPLDFWSPELQFERYVTECFGLADPA